MVEEESGGLVLVLVVFVGVVYGLYVFNGFVIFVGVVWCGVFIGGVRC